MTDTTLLPCPFCGSAAKLLRVDRGGRLANDTHAVTCSNDGCVVGPISDCATEAEAIAAWNRRDQWRTIESAPKDGSFLVYLPVAHHGSHIQTCFKHPNLTSIGGNFAFDLESKPTHWMPLPTPPAPVSGGK